MRGPKLFIAHAPCPTGWLYDPELTGDYARLAVETGIFALKEAVDGVVTHTYVPRDSPPVEEYLKGQGRYRHLLEPARNDEAIQHIQTQVDRYWANVHETTGAGGEAKPGYSWGTRNYGLSLVRVAELVKFLHNRLPGHVDLVTSVLPMSGAARSRC